MITKQQHQAMLRKFKKQNSIQKEVQKIMEKLYVDYDERGRPKLKVDSNYKAPEIRQITEKPIPYNNPQTENVLQAIRLPGPDQSDSELDHQRRQPNLLKPMEFLQVELLKQILIELKEIKTKL